MWLSGLKLEIVYFKDVLVEPKKPVGKPVGWIRSSRDTEVDDEHVCTFSPQRWVQVPTAGAPQIDPTLWCVQFFLTTHLRGSLRCTPALNYLSVSCLPASRGSDLVCGRLCSEDPVPSGWEKALSIISIDMEYPSHPSLISWDAPLFYQRQVEITADALEHRKHTSRPDPLPKYSA